MINLKGLKITEILLGVVYEIFSLTVELLEGSSEYVNAHFVNVPLGFIRDGKFFCQMSECYLYKKDTTPLSAHLKF